MSAASGEPTPSNRIVAVIPARAGSKRLPLKPLVPLAGEPLIWHVYRRVQCCAALNDVWVATDDARIQRAVERRGGQVIRIDYPCASGTERVAYAAHQLAADWVINVQGDEPFIDSKALSAVAGALRDGASIVTLATPLRSQDRANPSVVKVVCDQSGHALYFSRAAIPGDQHVGVYGFHMNALAAVAHLPRTRLAHAEDLEQLTWLEHGWPIKILDTAHPAPSIDTPADLARAQTRMIRSNRPENP